MIPLILRLKKTLHKELAKAQDLIMISLYKVFDKAVLHGGTAIWRCYQGHRFSEDVDVYLPRDLPKLDKLFEEFVKQGFMILKKKIGEISLYSSLQLNRNIVRFEVFFKTVDGTLKEYETAEGNYLTIYTLTSTELIREKVAAYTNRRKIRDLYDIFFLLRYITDITPIHKELADLLNNFKKPLDEKELKVLLLEGIVPATEKMLEYIQGRLDHGKREV